MDNNMRRIDIDTLMSWCPCHSRQWCKGRMPKGYLTPLQVVKHTYVTTPDKLWVLLRPEILPEQSLRLLAADFADRVLPIFESEYPECSHPRVAILTARLFAFRKVTDEELVASRDAAWGVSGDASGDAAWDVSRAASWAAAWGAARAAAFAALNALNASRAASRDVARDAGNKYQLARVAEYLRGNVDIEAIKRKAMREQRKAKESVCV